MKQSVTYKLQVITFTLLLALSNLAVSAQDKIVIDKQEAESWLSRNWIWVALGVLILLILLFSGSSSRRRRKTTTVVKDDYGNVKQVTTTEIDD